MSHLLGGPEAWDKNADALSTKLAALGMADEEVRQALPTYGVREPMIAILFLAVARQNRLVIPPEFRALVPKGWCMVKDVQGRISLDSKLMFPSILKAGEVQINGEILCPRARELGGNGGIVDAVFLRRNPHLIPAELRGAILVFPGTLILDTRQRLSPVCLKWDGAQWNLEFYWLDSAWLADCHLVCLA